MSPGRVNAADLPAGVRAKLVGRGERRVLPPRPPRPTSPGGDDLPARWRCHNCGAVFTAYAPAERHANTPGHRRIIFDLDGDR